MTVETWSFARIKVLSRNEHLPPEKKRSCAICFRVNCCQTNRLRAKNNSRVRIDAGRKESFEVFAFNRKSEESSDDQHLSPKLTLKGSFSGYLFEIKPLKTMNGPCTTTVIPRLMIVYVVDAPRENSS